MIDRAPLPVSRQVKLVGISRSSAYYAPGPVSAADLALMRRIDELHLEHPFAGARMLMRLLKREGIVVERRRVGTLMRKMGIEALYRKPNLSRKHLAHKIWPYLLRDRKFEPGNQVYALDTTYVPMAHGFVYLTAVIDWASRRVLAHRVAITMRAEHAVAALEEAFAKYGLPEIVNADQGSQFTSTVFTDALLSRGIALSMDGEGSWRDDVFIERLWRSVKYEKIYLKAYESVKGLIQVCRTRPRMKLTSRCCLRLKRQRHCPTFHLNRKNCLNKRGHLSLPSSARAPSAPARPCPTRCHSERCSSFG